MESKVSINVGMIAKCMRCGEEKECAEILVTVEIMPVVTVRLLICQSCWATAFGQFTKGK